MFPTEAVGPCRQSLSKITKMPRSAADRCSWHSGTMHTLQLLVLFVNPRCIGGYAKVMISGGNKTEI